jgi:hypothetical protein
MQLSVHAKTSTVPLWVVSNGEVTIGPVRTELLMRGIRHGRVPLDCRVRATGSEEWRELSQLREFAALSGQAGAVGDFQKAAAEVARARDEGDVLACLLGGAATATRATRGLVHAERAPLSLLVTSYALGGLEEALGQVLSPHDPAYTLAKNGQRLAGTPKDGTAERLVAQRLGSVRLAGVVMIPITYGTELTAMLELGREDRGFRQSDADGLSRLCTLAIARLEELLSGAGSEPQKNNGLELGGAPSR